MAQNRQDGVRGLTREARRVKPLAGVIAALLAGMAGAQPPAVPQAMPGRCAEDVGRHLQRWDAVPPPRLDATASVRHWPTRRLGTWLTEVRGAETVALLRVTPSRLTRLEWSAGCEVRTDDTARPAVEAPRFSDADLEALVASGSAGVLYVWSPHMPLSVDGYRALAAAAGARGVSIHVMLAPGADRAFARASLSRGGLPPEALRVADAVELHYRDVHLHTPAVLAFAKGHIAGDAWPGYHSADEYGAFLDRALGPRP